MIRVDWYDAFCLALWLGDEYQLPGEVQWEGAAWGGIHRRDHTDFCIGVDPYRWGFKTSDVCFNGSETWSGEQLSPAVGRTQPVRHNKYIPNGFGLWQMSGNVWEWCHSVWNDNLREAIFQRQVLVENTNVHVSRCVRGGSSYMAAGDCRCSKRIRIGADVRYDSLGFRLSRTS